MATRGRPPVRVFIIPTERATLEQWARRRTTAQGLAVTAYRLRCSFDATKNRARAKPGSASERTDASHPPPQP